MSRSPLLVLMVATSMVASTVDLVMSLSSRLAWPLTPVNAPETLDTIMWRTLKLAAECAVSISQPLACERLGRPSRPTRVLKERVNKDALRRDGLFLIIDISPVVLPVKLSEALRPQLRVNH